MTDQENEDELRRLLRQETTLDHRVEWMIALVMLALFAACWYTLDHPAISPATEAHRWLSNIWHRLQSFSL